MIDFAKNDPNELMFIVEIGRREACSGDMFYASYVELQEMSV